MKRRESEPASKRLIEIEREDRKREIERGEKESDRERKIE